MEITVTNFTCHSDILLVNEPKLLYRYLCSAMSLLWGMTAFLKSMTWAAATKRTQRIMVWLAKHHVKESEIPNRQYSIYIQAQQWLTSPKEYGDCVTERQAGTLGSTVHLLCSGIVHLLYTGIQTYSAAVSKLLTPKSQLEKGKQKRGRERFLCL